jgi:nucleoside triphosphate diphosphatase
MKETADPALALRSLLEVMRKLRDPDGGCPWDLAQDFASIAPHTLEEAHEVADAIARQDWPQLQDELGDLLFQVVFYARLGEERGWFDFGDVAAGIAAKLQRRHPHVFAPAQQGVRDPAELHRAWESEKAAERAASGAAGALDGVALALPALSRAAKIGKRAARVGFDWPDADSVAAKVSEELQELADARAGGEPAHMEEEFGDLLFAMAQYGRYLGIDPEAALRAATRKFETRFRAMEAALARDGQAASAQSAEDWDRRWRDAKRLR